MVMEIMIVVQVYQVFDVYGYFMVQIVFDGEFCDFFMQMFELSICEVFYFVGMNNICSVIDFLCVGVVDVENCG